MTISQKRQPTRTHRDTQIDRESRQAKIRHYLKKEGLRNETDDAEKTTDAQVGVYDVYLCV